MEDTVLSIRIVTTSAVLLALATASAAAQTATTNAPDKPLPLLQILQQKDGATVKPHQRPRLVRRRLPRPRIANHRPGAVHQAFMEVVPPEPKPAQPATTTDTANIWPAPEVTLPGMEGLTPPPIAAAPTSSEPVAPSSVRDKPDEVQATAYRTVQVAPQVTPPSSAPAAPPSTVQIAPANAGGPTDLAVDHPHDAAADTVKPSDAVATVPVEHAMAATVELQNPNPVGSTTWIAHVLAALGGAIATGTIAWLLINPMPSRRYG
jgi:hypothetical protein